MPNFSENLKQKLYREITSQQNYLGIYDKYEGIIDFLNLIWPLKDMPSLDSRFNNAEEDAFQHLINNSDWEYEYTFLERFNLLEDDTYFEKFLEVIVSPTVREDRGSIAFFVNIINQIIQDSEFKLTLVDYLNELPVYRLRETALVKDLPEDIKENNIPFYHSGSQSERAYPHFFLSSDRWDDYGNKTTFNLSYVTGTYQSTHFGKVKVMERESAETLPVLPDTFTNLLDNFCSLGMRADYYSTLKKTFENEYQSILLALRDVAFFPAIHEQFEDNDIYKTSLIRSNEVEQMVRTIRFTMNGIELSECFKFSYVFTPPYATDKLQLDYRFEYDTKVEHRLYAMIGKNGTGKTRILANLAKELSRSNSDFLFPRRPLYGKIFTVSYSVFDHFPIPTSDASFNYVYCGLKKEDGSFKTEDDILNRILFLADRIRKKKLERKWYGILKNFVPLDLLGEVFVSPEGGVYKTFQPQYFYDFYQKLSSGQNILVMIISEIISQIRLNSLILYDEPETHLHPNAITLLMNTIFELVTEFESFCILATHSPLVVQEIQARNIIIIERDNDVAYTRQMEKESFGENLTVITEEIFGNRNIDKHHLTLISDLVNTGEPYDRILNLLSSEGLLMNLNTKLYIKGLINQRNEKP